MDEEIREFIKQEMSYGGIDYNQRVEDVAEAFGLSLDEAEGYVWDYTIDPTTWVEGYHYVLEDSHGDVIDGYDDEQEAIEAAKNDPDCVKVSCYSDDTEDAEFIETTWTRESEEPDEPLKEEVLTEESAKSNGVYSLLDGWIKRPEKEDVPDDVDLEPELSEWLERAEEAQSIEDIDSFMDDIYKLRQESLLSGGEFSKGNLIFKELRNRGILEELKEDKIDMENDEMSLTTDEVVDSDLSDDGFIENDYVDEPETDDDLGDDEEYYAKLKEEYNAAADYYHRLMEHGYYTGDDDYDRNNHEIPICRDAFAQTTHHYGVNRDYLMKVIKGEDIWR